MKQQQILFDAKDRVNTDGSRVYVGDLEYPFRGMLMSHMASPDLEELHKMADAIGVSRRHFQNDKQYPHYDICKSKKKLAIAHGAEEISDRELIVKCYKELSVFIKGTF